MSMQEMALKTLLAAFGYTPVQIREQFELRARQTFESVATFEARLERIEQALGRIERVLSPDAATVPILNITHHQPTGSNGHG